MSIQQINSIPLVVDKIAQCLAPKDILTTRLVSPSWANAFEKAFIKTVPVVLNDSNLKDFTCLEGGSVRPRKMRNESFCLLTRLSDALRVSDVLNFCEKFGAQIKTLNLVILPSSAELTALSQVLAALKDTLEVLSLRLHMVHVDVHTANFPFMPKLKSLSFVNVTATMNEGAENQEFGPGQDGTSCFGILPLVVNSWSNLKHFKVSGFPRFQTKIFKKLRKESERSMKLVSLELDQCPVRAMKHISKLSLAAPLKHLRLSPYCAKEVHAPGAAPAPEDWQWPLSDSINRVLKYVAKDLVSLDLCLKTIFGEEELDEHWDLDRDWPWPWPEPDLPLLLPFPQFRNIPRLQKFPTLPTMPKLRFLTLTASDYYEENNHSQQYNFLVLRFDETEYGRRLSPSFKAMYPNLEVLRIINSADVDLAWNLISPDVPHHGVKIVEIQTVERSWSEIWKQSVLEKTVKAFPNANVNIILK